MNTNQIAAEAAGRFFRWQRLSPKGLSVDEMMAQEGIALTDIIQAAIEEATEQITNLHVEDCQRDAKTIRQLRESLCAAPASELRICDECSRKLEDGELYNDHTAHASEWECPECKTRYTKNVGKCGDLKGCSRPKVIQVTAHESEHIPYYRGIWRQTNNEGYKAADAIGKVCRKFNNPFKNNAWVYFVWEPEHTRWTVEGIRSNYKPEYVISTILHTDKVSFRFDGDVVARLTVIADAYNATLKP